MNLFFLFAVLMLALALLFMLLPLLKVAGSARTSERNLIETAYRTQFEELKTDLASGTLDVEQYEISKRELETRMHEELAQVTTSVVTHSPDSHMLARTAVALGITVPIAAAALYAWLGQPEAITGSVATDTSAAASDNAPHSVSGPEIEAMVQKLADRLKANPNDLQGWYMLARSYASLGRFQDSLKALDQARRLAPNEPQLMADYADVLATTRGGSLEGEPAKLIQKALQLDPNNAKALALAGEQEFRDKNYQGAIDYWTRMKNALPPDAKQEQIATVEKNINQAREALGQPPLPLSVSIATPVQEQVAPENPTTNPAAAGRVISGIVTVSPRLANKIGPDDTLFIFARAANGPRMPLAILKVSASELPKTFTLDDSMAMSPAMKLSDFPQVVVSARVSKSGMATPQSGDLVATTGPISPGTTDLKMSIDTIVK